jgi:hypothetical protein
VTKIDMVSRIGVFARSTAFPDLRGLPAFGSTAGQTRWKFRVSAWLIVAALIALAMVGVSAFHGSGSGIPGGGLVVTPMHDGRCPASGIETARGCKAGNAFADPEDEVVPPY